MIKKYIWDTGALSLFFMNHQKTKLIMQDISKSQAKGQVPLVVLSEFYYKTWQKFGEQAAKIRIISILEILEEVTLTSEDIFEVGELKVKNSELSMVDAIILTLTNKHGAILITTDTPITMVKGYTTIKLTY